MKPIDGRPADQSLRPIGMSMADWRKHPNYSSDPIKNTTIKRAVDKSAGVTAKERFDEFHERHPEVYEALHGMVVTALQRGRTKLGINMLIEVVRWERMVSTDDAEDFKINNNYAPHYARLLMDSTPEFEGVFETRTMRAA